MSSRVPTRLVERAGKQFDLNFRREAVPPSSRPPGVITISRQLGSGGRKIAEEVSRQLGWRLWDREILDVIVKQTDRSFRPDMFEFVDEKAQNSIDAFAYSLLGDVNKYLYLHLLPKALATIVESDAVILGRGAHIVLPDALKIRVVASMDTRVDNMARYEGLSHVAAMKRMRDSERERDAFLRDLAAQFRPTGPRVDPEAQYDLVISTDHVSIEEATGLIVTLAQLRFGKTPAKRRPRRPQDEEAATG